MTYTLSSTTCKKRRRSTEVHGLGLKSITVMHDARDAAARVVEVVKEELRVF